MQNKKETAVRLPLVKIQADMFFATGIMPQHWYDYQVKGDNESTAEEDIESEAGQEATNYNENGIWAQYRYNVDYYEPYIDHGNEATANFTVPN
ncbi:hypothetical protein MMC26_003827 [Xylographa opegraphella]|nr:hypothetical protein [Xylographa opegraphella]